MLVYQLENKLGTDRIVRFLSDVVVQYERLKDQ